MKKIDKTSEEANFHAEYTKWFGIYEKLNPYLDLGYSDSWSKLSSKARPILKWVGVDPERKPIKFHTFLQFKKDELPSCLRRLVN